MLDGAVARASGTVTRFGGFLDSTIDRYSEAVVLGGVLIYVLGTDDYWLGALLVFAAAIGSIMISYARARAEAAGMEGFGRPAGAAGTRGHPGDRALDRPGDCRALDPGHRHPI